METTEGITAAPLDKELASVCEKRAAMYGLLARLYGKEADEELLGQMQAMRFPVASGNADLDAGCRELADYLSGAWANTEAELAVDYTRIFVGEGVDAFSAAYPFESVYTSERRLMMQEARDEVLAIYRSVGLEKSQEWAETEDHVAAELEFMHVLAERCAQRLAEGDEASAVTLLETQRNFMEDHIARWVPLLTADMRRFARTGFYRGVAHITDGYLAVDSEFLNDVLEDDEEASDAR